jgi:heme-degrading monooxygenase HmoA
MIHQLRIYEIFEGTKDAFHARFRDHAARIMRRYGFHIVAMWEARTDRCIEFVYLLAWSDESTKMKAWAAFTGDREWAEIKRATSAQGDLVGDIEDRILLPTDYSPSFT